MFFRRFHLDRLLCTSTDCSTGEDGSALTMSFVSVKDLLLPGSSSEVEGDSVSASPTDGSTLPLKLFERAVSKAARV